MHYRYNIFIETTTVSSEFGSEKSKTLSMIEEITFPIRKLVLRAGRRRQAKAGERHSHNLARILEPLASKQAPREMLDHVAQ